MKKIKLKITHIIAASWPRASKGFLYRSAEVACPRKVLEDVDADLPGRFPNDDEWESSSSSACGEIHSERLGFAGVQLKVTDG